MFRLVFNLLAAVTALVLSIRWLYLGLQQHDVFNLVAGMWMYFVCRNALEAVDRDVIRLTKS
jgi:hypothetical protein